MEQHKRIGGIFAAEPLPEKENGLTARLAGPEDSLVHMMSGRCGIMLAIDDWMRSDSKRVAYLPAYTCETVSGCFVKKGYEVLYYDLDRDLRPLYDEAVLDRISLVLMCGYFGFATFDPAFAARCRERGIGVITDATHSVFTEGGIPDNTHYMAASIRKWLPVSSGGIAVKRGGGFLSTPEELHQEHIALRNRCYQLSAQAAETGDRNRQAQASDVYWETEMLLRKIYGMQRSDEESIKVVAHYPVDEMIRRRRHNFAALLEAFPQTDLVTPVFGRMPKGTCPSHFPVYSPKRDALQAALEQMNIHSTVYWPVPPFIDIEGYPGAKWIYSHILSLPCDQRYDPQDMATVARAVTRFAQSQ